jgi:hypothetical protein
MKSPPVWKDALALLSVRLVAAQLGLVALVFGLFLLWLRMPDASVMEVVGSGLLGLLIAAVACLGESRLILHLAGRYSTPARLLRGALSVIAGIVLWLLLSALIAHLGDRDALRAGYFNSKAPHQLRHLLTFEHILLWLGWIWTTIKWIGAGFIAAFVFTVTASAKPLRAATLVLRSFSFWPVLVIGTIIASLVTRTLMRWLPMHGLWPEMFSLGVRLSIAVLFDGIVACWFLATLAVLMRRADAAYSTPAGTPDDSQPRTVEAP